MFQALSILWYPFPSYRVLFYTVLNIKQIHIRTLLNFKETPLQIQNSDSNNTNSVRDELQFLYRSTESGKSGNFYSTANNLQAFLFYIQVHSRILLTNVGNVHFDLI